MKKIPVKEPKDLVKVELPPLKVERVEVKEPKPPIIKIGWWELFGTWLPLSIRQGMETDIKKVLRGEQPPFWSSLLNLLRQDWWKLAIIIVVPLLIWAAARILG